MAQTPRSQAVFVLVALAFALCLTTACQVPPDPPRFPDFPQQDALRYELDLTVDLERQVLVGTVTYVIQATAPLAAVRFHARSSDAWHVDFRDLDGKVLQAEWKKDTVTVELGRKIARGQTFRLVAHLAGTPVDGFYFKRNRYGEMVAFTDHYSIRARGWLPCEDHPADRARWIVRLTYPKGSEAVVFGRSSAPADNARPAPDGFIRRNWTSDAEVPPYMFALVVGPFARVAEAGDERLIPHFVYRQDVDKAREVLRHHAAWIRAMETTFGKYAYHKFTTVQCPTRWGGFEAPGNVQLSEGIFDRGTRGVGTLAHELVHMWFGDAVGYARWREVWLSEGFASYFGPWLHAKASGPDLKSSMRRMRDRWRKSFEGRTKSIRDDRFPHPDRALNSNTYPKGAWVLHMLRGELGDDVFFAALKEYYHRCAGKSVVTTDFVKIVEEVSKRELSWFFDQWLDRIGCPELDATIEPGRIIITQKQKRDVYRFWLRLSWIDGSGKKQTRRRRITERRTEIEASGEPKDIVLDPHIELLYR